MDVADYGLTLSARPRVDAPFKDYVPPPLPPHARPAEVSRGPSVEPAERRRQVLTLLRERGPMTRSALIGELGWSKGTLHNVLVALHEARDIRRLGAGQRAQWAVAGATGEAPGHQTEQPAADAADGASQANGLERALSHLELRVRGGPIEDLPLKIRVLDRLAAIVDPEIATVLEAVVGDLRRASDGAAQ